MHLPSFLRSPLPYMSKPVAGILNSIPNVCQDNAYCY